MIDPIGAADPAEIPTIDAARMAEVHRIASEEFGITRPQVLEHAGAHVAEVLRLELGGDLRGRDVVVAVGPGSIGGAGLAAARHLLNRGAHVRVVLAQPALRLDDDGRSQLATLIAMGAACRVATFDLPDRELVETLAAADMIIDAIMGSRSGDTPDADIERLAGFVVRAGRPVVSLDLPTGTDPDTGGVRGLAVTASATVILALPKRGLLAAAAAGRTGRLYLADIGLPAALYERVGLDVGPIFATGRIVAIDHAR